MKTFEKICDEPYRLFFPLGMLMALGGVGHWLFYALGWMSWYSGLLHASIQVQLYLACFVAGFLMTAVPRFGSTAPAKPWELSLSVGVLALAAGALFMRQWVISESLYALWLLLLARFIAARFLKRRVQYPPVEFVWIPPAIFLGVWGALIMVLALFGRLGPDWMTVGRSMQEQGFLLALVLGIGSFLGPRLMGVHQLPPINAKNFKAQVQRKIFLNAVCALLLIASFFLEGANRDIKAYALRAALVTGMFFWTRSINARVVTGPGIFVRLLSASYWMIAAGYWLVVFFPKLHVPLMHLVFLGGFSLMIFCISTMVILNHAGRGDLLNRPLWIYWLVLAGVAVSLSLRVLATFFGERYFSILGISAGIWMAVGTGWLVFSMPFICRVPGADKAAPDHKAIIEGTGHAC